MEYIRSEHYDHVRNDYGIEMVIPSEREWTEVKRGRWIVGNKTSVFDLAGVETWAVRMTCSECSFSLNFVEGHTAQYRFCPQCGARMENEI